MGVQLRKSKAWFGKSREDFYERGRYVAHNRDVRYSPTHSELSDCTQCTVYCRDTHQRQHCQDQATASQGPAWPALVTVASYLLDDNNDQTKLLVYLPHNDV